MKYSLMLFFILSAASCIIPQDGYFYKGRDYGSEAVYNPVSLILNGGFDMVQVDRNRDLSKISFHTGAKNVLSNLGDPFTAINNYGWWNFLKDQVIPISLDKSNSQYFPNYTLHLIGGGMTYVATKEWYEYHNYPYPVLFSLLTMASYHFINEV